MRNHLIITAGLITLSCTALADVRYSCTLNNAERLIEVVYDTEGQALPCHVDYTKEGNTKTLWNYANTPDACETKAAEFAEKQTQWGWSCNTSEPNQSKTEAAAE